MRGRAVAAIVVAVLVGVLIGYALKPAATKKARPEPKGEAVGAPSQPVRVTGGRVDLLALVDPERDSVTGTWEFKDNTLVCGASRREKIQFPYIPPEEYDFRMVFTALDVGAPMQIMSKTHLEGFLPHREFAWCMGGDGTKCGFEIVQGLRYWRNPTFVVVEDLRTPGQKHTSVVQVRKDGFRAYLDGKLLSEWKTDYTDVSMNRNWALRDSRFLGVGSYRARTAFHAIEVVEVTGTGTIVQE